MKKNNQSNFSSCFGNDFAFESEYILLPENLNQEKDVSF